MTYVKNRGRQRQPQGVSSGLSRGRRVSDDDVKEVSLLRTLASHLTVTAKINILISLYIQIKVKWEGK